MNRLPNYGCLLLDSAKREDRIRDLEIFARLVAKIERDRCELLALRIRDKMTIDSWQREALESLVKSIHSGSEFEDIAI